MRTLSVLFLLMTLSPSGADPLVQYQGEPLSARVVSQGDHDFIEAKPLLEVLGWHLKELGPGRVGLCTQDLCVPLELERQGLTRDGTLFLNLAEVAPILELEVERSRQGLKLSRSQKAPSPAPGPERIPEFQLESVGQTHDQSIGEVLRGKRSLLFCFASW